MTDHEQGRKEEDSRSIWALLSIAIPVVAVVLGFLVVASGSSGAGGDMVGQGLFVYAMAGAGIVGVFGTAAAIKSVLRREDCLTLASVSLLVNLALVVVGALAGWSLLR